MLIHSYDLKTRCPTQRCQSKGNVLCEADRCMECCDQKCLNWCRLSWNPISMGDAEIRRNSNLKKPAS